jgi:hypothetical protein
MRNNHREFAPEESEAGASAGKTNNPAREFEQQAATKRAGDPGSIENAAGMHGDLDGGGGIGEGTNRDPHLDRGDTGPTPDKVNLQP